MHMPLAKKEGCTVAQSLFQKKSDNPEHCKGQDISKHVFLELDDSSLVHVLQWMK